MKKTKLRIASGHPAKSKFLAIIIVSLLSLIAVGEAQADDADPTHGLSVDLIDGSHIIGIPSTKAVPVDTPYGKMDGV